MWGKLAETVAEHKSKGDLVAAVQGRLIPVHWTTDEAQKRSTVKVTAEEINSLDRSEFRPSPASRLRRAAAVDAAAGDPSATLG